MTKGIAVQKAKKEKKRLSKIIGEMPIREEKLLKRGKKGKGKAGKV